MPHFKKFLLYAAGGACLCAAGFALVYVVGYTNIFAVEYSAADVASSQAGFAAAQPEQPPLNTVAYDQKLLELAHATSTVVLATSTDTTAPTTSWQVSAIKIASSTPHLWPVKTVYPDAGAILPFSRIVAYYGNFYSTGMGVLGEYPPQQVLQMLQGAVAEWQAADPTTPVIPAIDYIAVTAQGSAGQDGKYRLRMPASQIDKAIAMAAQVHGLVFLDVQVGLSNVQTEVPLLEPFLKLPQVELAIDPEFAMHGKEAPGTVIGTFDASDINFVANYLANVVTQNNLPPKILVVHRFTQDMVTNYKKITPLPQVEVVMDMDGWGSQAKKINTYQRVIYSEPVQFTGLKLFYKNDLRPPSTGMLTPAQVLNLTPQPIFIQYQ